MQQITNLIFSTSNKNKAREASDILGYKVNTPEKEISIPEIQLESRHWKEVEAGNYTIATNYVASNKAICAEKAYGKTVLVEDVALFIPALKGRPGTDIKAWCDDELLAIFCEKAHSLKNKKVIVICTLAISINEKVQLRHAELEGTLAKAPIGNEEGSFGWDRIFCPRNSELTYAQDISQKQHSHRALSFKKLKDNPFKL